MPRCENIKLIPARNAAHMTQKVTIDTKSGVITGGKLNRTAKAINRFINTFNSTYSNPFECFVIPIISHAY